MHVAKQMQSLSKPPHSHSCRARREPRCLPCARGAGGGCPVAPPGLRGGSRHSRSASTRARRVPQARGECLGSRSSCASPAAAGPTWKRGGMSRDPFGHLRAPPGALHLSALTLAEEVMGLRRGTRPAKPWPGLDKRDTRQRPNSARTQGQQSLGAQGTPAPCLSPARRPGRTPVRRAQRAGR